MLRIIVLSLTALTVLAGCADADVTDVAPPVVAEEPPCTYPEAAFLEGTGSIMPNLAWTDATNALGEKQDFSLEGFFCDAEYERYTSVTFILFTDWCPNCPDYLRMVAGYADQLDAAGSYLVALDLETTSFSLPTNANATWTVDADVGSGAFLRLGDGDTDPPGFVHESTSLWSAVPGGFVVRKSDMKVIVNQDDWQTILHYPTIVQHLDADWSNPNNPPFFSKCAEGDEELSEPNDTPTQAVPLIDEVTGGICAAEPDFYSVDIPGNWRLDLTFTNAVGDLDVYVVDATGAPLEANGGRVGGESADDDETFTHAGPATIMVQGYMGASAPYELALTAIP